MVHIVNFSPVRRPRRFSMHTKEPWLTSSVESLAPTWKHCRLGRIGETLDTMQPLGMISFPTKVAGNYRAIMEARARPPIRASRARMKRS
jgi:hypothetical protein